MATLKIINTFEFSALGQKLSGKHGLAEDSSGLPLEVDVEGLAHYIPFSLATAAVQTVYDDDSDVPDDWVYLYLWADQDIYIQLIGSSTNVIFKVEAYQPFVLPGFDSLLAAADTTIITGGSEPSLQDIDSVVIGNYSGSTVNGIFAVIE